MCKSEKSRVSNCFFERFELAFGENAEVDHAHLQRRFAGQLGSRNAERFPALGQVERNYQLHQHRNAVDKRFFAHSADDCGARINFNFVIISGLNGIRNSRHLFRQEKHGKKAISGLYDIQFGRGKCEPSP